MVNPTAIDAMSSAMADVYASVTDRILINLAHHFQYIKDGRAPTGSFEYQSRMLAEMGQVTKESSDIIQAMLGGADEALKTVLENAIAESLKDEEPKLQQAAKLGLIGKGSIPELTPNQMQAFKAYYNQSADKLNLVNTVMLESTQAAYTGVISDIVNRINNTQSILNASAGEVITGVSTWNKAMHDAVHRMVSNGLTGFIDHAGRRWSPEAYVAMDIRTTLFNTGRAAIWERQEQYGNDLYQVSSHAGARPLCYPWQGKVISRTDMVRDVEDLDGNTVHVYAQSETTYGQAAGLFGINCKHYPMTFIPGFSTLKGEPQSEKVNEKTYEESQQQRALERKLRFEKRELSVLKAQGADQEAIKAQRNKVFEASADIDAFCDATGRARRRNREYTPINAKFPSRFSYDPKLFPTQQQQAMRSFFGNVKKVANVVNVASQATQTPQNVVQSNDSVEKALNIKRGKPIDAGKARTWTNPDYSPSNYGYSNNCQRCVQTYELRRRGYDVEAMPKPRRNNTVCWGSEIFEDYGKSRASAISAYSAPMTEADVKQAIDGAPDGSRYSVYVKWKRSRSAHVFIAEKTNGQVQYLDPQVNKRNCESYFADGVDGQFRIFRMDDKNLTTDDSIIKKTVRKAR